MRISKKAETTLSIPIIAALVSVYFFWGTTYLAMKYAVETFPPFLMLGVRFGVTGFFMIIVLYLRGTPMPSSIQWGGAFITGAMMLFLGTGCVTLAELEVPSNIAATVIASTPLWMAFFQWALFREGRPPVWNIIGLGVGFIGVIMLIMASGNVGGSIYGYLLLVFAASMWALGSLISRVIDAPKSPFMSIGAQMFCGGVCCLVAALFTGEFAEADISKFSAVSMFAILYLVMFGSLVGYGSYVWLLRNTSPTLVSTYAYVNPVVAIFMGWLIAGETLNEREIIAALVILASVMAIIKGNMKKA